MIATPIHLHREISISAMEKGFHVLLEKPPAVTIQDFDAMIQAQKASGVLCQVDFQNSSGMAFRLLIEKLKQGAMGNVEIVTGVGMWRRTDDYYARASWAGRLTLNGNYVLDGTINNSLAHLLHNCLIAAGYGRAEKAVPETVQGELYHGHNIESEDTTCLRIKTAEGVEVRYYATLCNTFQDIPYIIVRGSRGEAVWMYDNRLNITYNDGIQENYTFPEKYSSQEEVLIRNMYLNLILAIEGKTAELYNSLEDCRSWLLASNGAFESSQGVATIPEQYLTVQEESNTLAQVSTSMVEKP